MKNRIYSFLIFSFIFAAGACKKSEPTANVENTGATGATGATGSTGATGGTGNSSLASGVYAAGITNLQNNTAQAAIWKNGVPTILSTSNSYAIGLATLGSDVYTVGYLLPSSNQSNLSQPCYWKNALMIKLFNDDNQTGKAKAILVKGNDVYIAGDYAEGKTGPKNAVYWKNGVKTTLPSPSSGVQATANGIAIAGTDVYVSGTFDDPLNSNYPSACYWKNGVLISLDNTSAGTNGSANSGTSAIINVEGDIYITGTIVTDKSGKCYGVYWKNGVLNKLASTNVAESASGITTNGTDIYIFGYSGGTLLTLKPIYWKNGTLNTVTQFWWLYAAAAQGNDLYLGGTADETLGYGVITKNGTSILNQTTNARSIIYGLIVIP